VRVAELREVLFGRRERRARDEHREEVVTLATALTVFRALAAAAILITAVASRSHTLLLVGLSVSMLLDFVDGQVARWGDGKETIFGAQLDGFADRLAVAFTAAGMVALYGDSVTLIAAAAVWIQFGVVDGLLASQFLRFGLWSPDHFWAVDPKTWRWNWSVEAKLASNLPIVMLAAGGAGRWAAIALSVALVAVRIPSYWWIRTKAREQVPELNRAKRRRAPAADVAAEPDSLPPQMPQPDAPVQPIPRVIVR
jgi:phosphatidylglycerophosphate synthase